MSEAISTAILPPGEHLVAIVAVSRAVFMPHGQTEPVSKLDRHGRPLFCFGVRNELGVFRIFLPLTSSYRRTEDGSYALSRYGEFASAALRIGRPDKLVDPDRLEGCRLRVVLEEVDGRTRAVAFSPVSNGAL